MDPIAVHEPKSAPSNQRDDTLGFPPTSQRHDTLRFPPSHRRLSAVIRAGDMEVQPSGAPAPGSESADSPDAWKAEFSGCEALVGDVIADRYVLEALIAEGGMGVVWRAHDQRTQRSVAIKLVSPRSARAAEATERLREEATLLMFVDSPHVARIIDAGGMACGAPYLVTELLDGVTLQQVLETRQGVELRDAIDWMCQVANGLADIHDVGLVHNDLKPSNVFLTRGDAAEATAKLLDFGVASARAGHTPMGFGDEVLGNPWYLAPERIAAAACVDHRADIWSVGVVLYELLAGRRPFEGDTVVQVCEAVMAGSPPPLGSLRKGVSAELAKVVGRCLQPRPDDRYFNARALARDLRRISFPQLATAVTNRVHAEQVPSLTPAEPHHLPNAGTKVNVTEGASVGPTSIEPFVRAPAVLEWPERSSPDYPPEKSSPRTAQRRRWPTAIAYSLFITVVVVMGVAAVARHVRFGAAHSGTDIRSPLTREPNAPAGMRQEPLPAPLVNSRSQSSSEGIASQPLTPPVTKELARSSPSADRDQRAPTPARRPSSRVRTAAAATQPAAQLGIPVNQIYINNRGELVDAQGNPLGASNPPPIRVPPSKATNSARGSVQPSSREPLGQ